MKISELTKILENKIKKNLSVESINIEDKTYLHKKHIGHTKDKFHIKIILKSNELKKLSKIEGSRLIHNIIKDEIKNNIHSIQLQIH